MSAPIVLPPSADQHALVNGIREAAARHRTLLLEPGIHFTLPGKLQTIPIGPAGITIGATALKAVIKRPDFSIPPADSDFNYGLFFIPSPPTNDELAAAVWKPFPNANPPFEFAVFIRGSIAISGLTVDSNMGKQKLETAPPSAADHSAMLGFSGLRYRAPDGPNKIQRFIYIGFENVTVHDLTCEHGGYADDIWFAPSNAFFHPNIERVDIRNVFSQGRVDPHRGTITFSIPAENINIQNCNIYQLHAETDADWKQAPRKDDSFTASQWSLEGITAESMIFSMQGKVVKLAGSHLFASAACQIELAGGKISDSTFTVLPGKASRFFRLDGLLFENVRWRLNLNDTGGTDGIMLGARANDTCSASFHKNSFQVLGSVSSGQKGQLINSAYSESEPRNSVTATFRQCEYEAGFGSDGNSKIARVLERGTWRFAKEDFQNRDPKKAIEKGPQLDIVLIVAPSKTLP